MSEHDAQDITRILLDLGADDADHQATADQLFRVLYDELHRLAHDLMRGERCGHTLQSTALVHEAYLKLIDDAQIDWRNRTHFFGIAARAMRRILVDHARRRDTQKRGGKWRRVTLDEGLGLEYAQAEVVALDDALDLLSEQDHRMARVVELKVFAGMTVVEIAHLLGFSRQTIHEDWRVARMWLRRVLAEGDVS